jgi:hypothetical protein
MLNECRNSSLLPPIKPYIWNQFQLVFMGSNAMALSSKMELVLNNLRAILFNDQPLLSGQLSKPFCAALILPLHCVFSGLYVCESYPLSWGIVDNVYIVYSPAGVQSFWAAQER